MKKILVTTSSDIISHSEQMEAVKEAQSLLFNYFREVFPEISIPSRTSGASDRNYSPVNCLRCANFICDSYNKKLIEKEIIKAQIILDRDSEYRFHLSKPKYDEIKNRFIVGILISKGNNPEGARIKDNLARTLTKLGQIISGFPEVTAKPKLINSTELLLGWKDKILSAVRSDEKGLDKNFLEIASGVIQYGNALKSNKTHYLGESPSVKHLQRERIANLEGLEKSKLISLQNKLRAKKINSSILNTGLKLVFQNLIFQVCVFTEASPLMLKKFHLTQTKRYPVLSTSTTEIFSGRKITVVIKDTTTSSSVVAAAASAVVSPKRSTLKKSRQELSMSEEDRETPFYKMLRERAQHLGLKYTEFPSRKDFLLHFPHTPHPNGGAVHTAIHFCPTGGQYFLTCTYGKEQYWRNLLNSIEHLKASVNSLYKEVFFLEGKEKVVKFLTLNEPKPGGII